MPCMAAAWHMQLDLLVTVNQGRRQCQAVLDDPHFTLPALVLVRSVLCVLVRHC